MPKREASNKRKTPAVKRRSAGQDDRKQGDRKSKDGQQPSAGFLQQHIPTAAAVRDGVHFVVEILVLVFLIITFEVQAFVIPTGSLAPTLLGRHKDVQCPQCDYTYQISAAGEVDSGSGTSLGIGHLMQQSTCPMCRFPTDIGPGNPQGEDYPSFAGERILVSRFAYEFADPQRWDIAPFKYPGDATVNYIKRLVGKPNETVRIHHGDLLVRKAGEPEFHIARKPPEKVFTMAQPVHDNDYVVAEIIQRGWPARWGPEPAPDSAPGGWVTSEDYRRFRIDGSRQGEMWLRYRHIVPSDGDWWNLQAGKLPDGAEPKPQLIADFCAYNSGRMRQDVADGAPKMEGVGLHWVGDLTVACTMDVQSKTGEVVLELVEGGRRMQCRIDVASGSARLSIDGLTSYNPQATTSVVGPGSHEIRFANVDDRLLLWVDGRLVEFSTPTEYPYDAKANLRPREEDLSPVGIASRGVSLRIDHLKIFRDVYYIANIGKDPSILTDFAFDFGHRSAYGVAEFLSNPDGWDAFLVRPPKEFALGPDQFLALGDNSPRSKDSRLWNDDGFEHYVSRDLLLGKALLVIWPHSPVTIPGTSIPCLPNVPNDRPVR